MMPANEPLSGTGSDTDRTNINKDQCHIDWSLLDELSELLRQSLPFEHRLLLQADDQTCLEADLEKRCLRGVAAACQSPEFPDSGDEPRIFQSGLLENQTRTWLSIPFGHFEQHRIFAWSDLTRSDFAFSDEAEETGILKSLAASVVARFELLRDNISLKSEATQFAQQTIANFEELCSLRHIAEQLSLRSASANMVQMAEVVVPMLQQSIRSESVAVLFRSGDGKQQPGYQVILFGEQTLDESGIQKLVKKFSVQCDGLPLVRNHCRNDPEFAEFENVENLIMTAVRQDDELLGWLVVINKKPLADHWLDHDETCRFSDEFGSDEATTLATAASILATHISNLTLLNEKEDLLTRIVLAMVSALDAKDPYTCGHSERVARYARRIGLQLGLDNTWLERLYLTGLLHDVGKIGVNDATLRKPGNLTDSEFREIMEHPDIGWSILVGLEQLKYVLPGVLYHHERVDGKGYPDGLTGDNIPLDARILAVADAFDAMTSDRPYRDGMQTEKAVEILLEGRGTQWDAKVVTAFVDVLGDIAELKERWSPRKPVERSRGSAEPASS